MSASATASPDTRVRRRLPFWAQVLIGLAVGIVLGFLARAFALDWLTETLNTVGTIFVQLLRVIVVPLVLTALIVSITQLRHVTNAARLAVQTLVWFAITALVSVVIGIGIGVLTNPGASATISLDGARASSTQGSWLDFLKSLVPANFLGLEVSSRVTPAADTVSVATSLNFNVLQLVVIGIALGAAALAVGAKAEPFVKLAQSTLEIFQKLVWWIILLAPLGVFALDVYLGCALVLFGLYPLLLKLHGLSVRRFFAGAWEAITFAFVSRSSLGTLPVTQANTIDKLGVPRTYASFAVPLGATTKMDGCAAIYPALAAITVAQLFGVPLTLQHYVLIAFVAVVGSAATAGLTGAIVMLTLTLSTLGLPLEGVGLLLAIDPILDMARTATNVAGQALVPTIVAKRNGILDEDVYNGRVSTGSATEPALV